MTVPAPIESGVPPVSAGDEGDAAALADDRLRRLRSNLPGPAEQAGRLLAAANPALAQSTGLADLLARLEDERNR